MADLVSILSATLSPDANARRQAERALLEAEAKLDFGPNILQLVQNPGQPKPVRQSAALAFKNWIRANWALEEAPTPLAKDTAEALKREIIGIMIQLSNEPALQVQIGEAISIMAAADFPDDWPDLVDQLTSNVSDQDFTRNNAVLHTAHSIFKRWRSEFRSDGLFLEIKYVLDRFCEPYKRLFIATDQALSSSTLPAAQLPVLQHTLLLLLQLYHDLNAQDIPEFFEDNLKDFMSLLIKYIEYGSSTQQAAEDDDEEEATDLEKIRAEICSIASLYALRYLDLFGDYLGPFVEKTWTLLTQLGPAVRYDILVAKGAGFLSTAVKLPSARSLFEQRATLEAFCEKIVLPNMTLRTFEEELFEDDPSEYVRRDLDVNSETRRQAASDFVKALMEQFEAQVTEIITRYVGTYLQEYAKSPQSAWKHKDTAIYLLTSIASRGATQTQGVTSTNALVDVIAFFSEHVASDLQAGASVHPIIKADAIKFLYTFRNQLTKEQLLSVIPMLIPHLRDPAYVIHTYAAMTIERILFMKQDGALVFGQSDIRPHAEAILDALFSIIEKGQTPQQLAANDNLMKTVMRVIVTARQALTPTFGNVLNHLTKILGEIAKNPSNPRFNHYTFESISALVRFVTAGNVSTLAQFESALFPPFHAILAQDVSEFVPFVFQILSQLLETHPANEFPESYQALLPPLLTPALWESRGNIPALVRLLRAFLSRGADRIVAANQVQPMLGIFQHLIGSKANDQHGFDLLEAIVEFVPMSNIRQFMSNPVFVLLLTRLQSSKTDKFSTGLLKLIATLCVIEKEGLNADAVVAMLDGVQPQPGLFAQVVPVLLPQLSKVAAKDRKLVAVGLTNLLTRSNTMLNPPHVSAWPSILSALLNLLNLPVGVTSRAGTAAGGDADEIDVPDDEEVTYQASFSRLGASERARPDPVAKIADPKAYLAEQIARVSNEQNGKMQPLLAAASQDVVVPFVEYMQNNGLVIR